MYTSFFKRERQHDPFRAKEIINRGKKLSIDRYTCIPRSLIQFPLNWKVKYSSICFSLGLRKPLDTVEYLFFVVKECSCCN